MLSFYSFSNDYRTVFPKEQIEAAIRFMATGKHMGKVILKIRDENEPLDSTMMGLPRYNCLDNRSYVILGGLGGFGLELGKITYQLRIICEKSGLTFCIFSFFVVSSIFDNIILICLSNLRKHI